MQASRQGGTGCLYPTPRWDKRLAQGQCSTQSVKSDQLQAFVEPQQGHLGQLTHSLVVICIEY